MNRDLVRLLLFILFTQRLQALETPRVVFVIVVDQLGMNYINRLQPFLSHGLYKLFAQGVVYTNAHQPHGNCVTAAGHAGIGTGALPKDHGITDNSWFDKDGTKIAANAHDARYMQLPTLNQTFLADNPNNKAIAISLKDRAAIGMADDDAPAVWFKNNKFVTNSTDKSLRVFLKRFNKKHPLLKPHTQRWTLAYQDPRYYRLPDINNYTYAALPSVFSQKNPLYAPKSNVDYFRQLTQLPASNKLLLDLALDYLKNNYQSLNDGTLLIWISLSSLDKMGHFYGPYSKETTDTIYHLDQQLQKFMDKIAAIVPPAQTLYVLTADHGVMPIPELLKKRGYPAHRIDETLLAKKLNRAINKKFNVPACIHVIDSPFLYFNQAVFAQLPFGKQQEITHYTAQYLQKIPGIKYAIPTRELAHAHVAPATLNWFLQNQLYPDRSGDLVIAVAPYTVLSKHPRGTKHNAPYSYNTHVPLIFYQPGTFENQTISDRVWVPQLNATIARILHIPPASNKALPALPLTVTLKNPKQIYSTAQKPLTPLPRTPEQEYPA